MFTCALHERCWVTYLSLASVESTSVKPATPFLADIAKQLWTILFSTYMYGFEDVGLSSFFTNASEHMLHTPATSFFHKCTWRPSSKVQLTAFWFWFICKYYPVSHRIFVHRFLPSKEEPEIQDRLHVADNSPQTSSARTVSLRTDGQTDRPTRHAG